MVYRRKKAIPTWNPSEWQRLEYKRQNMTNIAIGKFFNSQIEPTPENKESIKRNRDFYNLCEKFVRFRVANWY